MNTPDHTTTYKLHLPLLSAFARQQKAANASMARAMLGLAAHEAGSLDELADMQEHTEKMAGLANAMIDKAIAGLGEAIADGIRFYHASGMPLDEAVAKVERVFFEDNHNN